MTAGIHGKEEKVKRERAKEEARATWEKEAGIAPDELYSRAGIDIEAANIRQAMEAILNEHAKKRRVCVRSKVWWTKEIAELRKKRGQAVRERRHNPATYGAAQRNLRRAIRKAKKSCWEEHVQGADKEQLWRAVRYTAPRLEGKAQPLVDETGTKATSREERELMLIATAFPEAPDAGEQTPLPDGGHAHQRVNENRPAACWPRRETRAPPEETGWGRKSSRSCGNGLQSVLQHCSGHASNSAITLKAGRRPKEW